MNKRQRKKAPRCPACNSFNVTVRHRKRAFAFYQCRDCWHHWMPNWKGPTL